MKGHPTIYLLATALAATCVAVLLSGCAENIRETEPNFAVHAHVTLGQGVSNNQPGIVIESIYKTDAPAKIFTPSSTALDLWLHSGDYVAKIGRCNQSANDADLMKYGLPLGPDHLFKFSVQTNGLYHLLCTTASDGTTYMWNGEVIEVVG